MHVGFEVPHRHDTDTGLPGELFLTPIEKAAGSSALGGRHHGVSSPRNSSGSRAWVGRRLITSPPREGERHHVGDRHAHQRPRRRRRQILEAGLVDDGRFAANRAWALAERGWGDAAIRVELERHELAAEPVDQALAGLQPERQRVLELVRRRGPGPATVRYLSARGFDADAVEAAVERLVADDPGTALT